MCVRACVYKLVFIVQGLLLMFPLFKSDDNSNTECRLFGVSIAVWNDNDVCLCIPSCICICCIGKFFFDFIISGLVYQYRLFPICLG